jgi:hypothetical protein
MRPNLPKLIFALLLSTYFLWMAYDPMQGSFLDNVDLAIHEAGHLLFSPFGQFISVAGGSLLQIIFPAAFVGYFLWQEQRYSAAIVALWLGQSVLNVYVYAADAQVMQIVLLGGLTGSEGSFHDWNYLLTETGLIRSTKTVASVIRLAGTLTIIIGSAAAVYYSFKARDHDL